ARGDKAGVASPLLIILRPLLAERSGFPNLGLAVSAISSKV
ncbi:MAG: hypothetical protein ACD_50C00242G0002, partial [uncultured bacterium]